LVVKKYIAAQTILLEKAIKLCNANEYKTYLVESCWNYFTI